MPPPLEVVRDIPAWPQLPFPQLVRIVHGPTWSKDGLLLSDKGFHVLEGIYIDESITVIEFTGSGAEAAEWINQELFVDFPVGSEADRANLFAALITCFVRDMIDGGVPMFGLQASIHGAGKGLAVDVVVWAAFGPNGAELAAYSDDDDEIRKRLTSTFRKGPPAIKWDNINDRIDSSSLCSSLTSIEWSDRKLGTNEIVTYPIRAVQFSTANNPALSGEMARRYVSIRLIPMTETPWTRTDFRHPELLTWVSEHRGEIIGAVARMINTWIAAGRPAWSGRPLGSFEAWSKIVGGILESCGIEQFMGNHAELFSTSDDEGSAWHILVERWYERYQDALVTSSELFEVAQSIDDFPLPGKTDRAQRTAFGSRLAKQQDRVFDDRRVLRSQGKKNGARYQLLMGNLGNQGNLWPRPTREGESDIYLRGSQGQKVPDVPQVPRQSKPGDGGTDL